MSIDHLTYGELKEIARMFSSACEEKIHPMVGKYVIVRANSAGVHAGELVSQSGSEAILNNSRRLWDWKTPEGIALSGVSQYGLVKEQSKIDTMVPQIGITGVIETILCSNIAKESINNA
jgi:hypothetical protein